MLTEAKSQVKAAQGTGATIEWHVSTQASADEIRKIFEDEEISGIEVLYIPKQS